jgi:restriction system protein
VRREGAEGRILASVERRERAPLSGQGEEDSAGQGEEDSLLDVEELAREQVRQLIGRKFAGHELARLVGALLEARGLRVSVSEPGPDRGVDILAGSGPLGLDQPRIAVQVKTGQADVAEVRALQGVMTRLGAAQGLLVAWGGFRGTARAEARDSYFTLRLWDADSLLDELFQAYERLPDDIRSEIPLQRVWTVVPSEPS